MKKSLIVFVSDHGESLSEHGESTHGYFIYQSTLHVPLIIHWPGGVKPPLNERIDEPASLLDVAPTILDVLGLPMATEMRGRSLIREKGEEAIYSESLYAQKHFGCAALRALWAGSYKYIEAPNPELYDLSHDPNESRNLYLAELPRASAMRQRIMALGRHSSRRQATNTLPRYRKGAPGTRLFGWVHTFDPVGSRDRSEGSNRRF